jgi:hypothetical protein
MKMPKEDRERAVELRIRSKRGQQLSAKDSSWLVDIYLLYPDDYPKDLEIVDLIREQDRGAM